MKRRMTPVSIVLFVVLTGCSSTPSTVASSATPADTTASSVAPSDSVASSPPPSETPSSSTVAGGTATDFCGAFKEIQAVSDTPSGDLASAGAKFQGAAADMRKYAPAEIEKAANTYADVMDNIGKAVSGGSVTQADMAKAVSDGIAGNAKDIGTVALWVAKNCKL